MQVGCENKPREVKHVAAIEARDRMWGALDRLRDLEARINGEDRPPEPETNTSKPVESLAVFLENLEESFNSAAAFIDERRAGIEGMLF